MIEQQLGVDEIFGEALALDAERRAAFLDAACQGQPALRERIERLLNAHPLAKSFLEAPALGETTAPREAAAEIGSTIGAYKLLELIGEGGMGLVYMAEQQRPVRRLVALKIIKPGLDSRQVIARFEAERQALAMMDHPGIARILEAGTVGGRRVSVLACSGTSEDAYATDRPYFVMELVRGLPITEFCDHKQLGIRERLALFIQVCQAVQHAHQKGIIHRDLKPTNVLVTMADAVPLPKIIDFGIAKALEGPGVGGQEPGARSQDTLTRRASEGLALARSASEGNPVRLTEKTLHTGYAQMIGTPLYMSPEQADLNAYGVDTRSDVYSLGVILYELLTGTTPFDKDRLKTATFEEIRRIIREEPPETISQRLARTRTERAGVDAGVNRREGTVAKRWSAASYELDWIVTRCLEKDRTRRYESPSSLAADIERYLADEAVQACPPSTGYRLRKLVRRHRALAATSAAIALSLIVGTVIATWQAVEARAARKLADERLALANERLRNETKAYNVAQTERNAASFARARAEAGQRQARDEGAAADAISEFLIRDVLLQVDIDVQKGDGYEQDPTISLRDAIERASSKLARRFQDQPLREATIRMAFGGSFRTLAQFERAVTQFQRASELRERALGPESQLTLDSKRNLAQAYSWVGRHADAISQMEAVVASMEVQHGRNSLATRNAESDLAGIYSLAGKWDLAISRMEDCLARRKDLNGPEQDDDLGCLRRLAVAYRDGGRLEEGITLLERIVLLQVAERGSEDRATVFDMHVLAMAYHKAGRYADADHWLREALANNRVDVTGGRNSLANLQTHLSMNLLRQRRFGEAESIARQSLEIFANELPDNWRRFHAQSVLGGALLGLGRLAEAEPHLLQGLAGMESRRAVIFACDQVRLVEAQERLVELYERLGRPQDAEHWRK